jgi:hypothetical protein
MSVTTGARPAVAGRLARRQARAYVVSAS